MESRSADQSSGISIQGAAVQTKRGAADYRAPNRPAVENSGSILFDEERPNGEELEEKQDFIRDLNLNQIVTAITKGRQEYNLKPFFYTRPTELRTIEFRQQVMRDLEKQDLFQSIKVFASRMRSVRENLAAAKNQTCKYSSERWFLDAVDIYCAAVKALSHDFDLVGPNSRGLRAFQRYLDQYVESNSFKMLVQQINTLKSDVSAIRYCTLVKGGSVTVRTYNSEEDYTEAVERTFAKFKQGAVKEYLAKLPPSMGMNHVEAEILDRVAKLYPDTFRALDGFCAMNRGFFEERIAAFDREIQFYVAYLEYEQTFKRNGLKFCYPHVSDSHGYVSNRDGFDLALAAKLIGEKRAVVCNDFELSEKERILVVTGPNQGGKTTFARVFGQIHYLASLGCPVPGSEARLFLFDSLFTHFEREEKLTTLRGKLQDDLTRIHGILSEATPNSLIIINEIFSSTTIKDGILLGKNVMERLSRLDALCVCVTFLDELAAMNDGIVSVVAGVAPDNPSVRTFRIERRPADGLAHALAIAEKYRLTYDSLKERIKL